ncbi:hypothetical protein O6P43_033204, partial [Quillaja saponaria]
WFAGVVLCNPPYPSLSQISLSCRRRTLQCSRTASVGTDLAYFVGDLDIVEQPLQSLTTVNGLSGSIQGHVYVFCTITSQQVIHYSSIQDNSIICWSLLTTKCC